MDQRPDASSRDENYTNFMAKLKRRPDVGWPDMLPDILGSIANRLPLADFLAFRRVCRGWRSAPSGRSEIFKFNKDKQWLMFYDVDDDGGEHTGYLYTASHPTCCTLRLPDLEGATIVESKLGWFLARDRGGGFFFYNPFSLQKIEFAPHRLFAEQACTFSGSPTCSSCTVYVLSRPDDATLEFSLRRVGEAEWTRHTDRSMFERRDPRQIRILGVYSCCCDDGGGRRGRSCTWDCKESVVVYCQPTNEVDYYDKRVMSDSWNHDDDPGVDPNRDPFRELELRHGGDWLQRFGRRTISIASLSRRPSHDGDSLGSFAESRAVGIDGEIKRRIADGETEAVKAAWVEPQFALRRVRKNCN